MKTFWYFSILEILNLLKIFHMFEIFGIFKDFQESVRDSWSDLARVLTHFAPPPRILRSQMEAYQIFSAVNT